MVARSIAFGGAVFGWPYYAGVAAYLQGAAYPLERIYGTSSGAVIATMLACGIDVARDGLELGLRADARGLGERRTLLGRSRAFLAPHLEELERTLPADAHVRASGRLFIAVRRVLTWKRLVISDYPTRAALLDVLAGAVAVPAFRVRLVHWSQRHGALVDGGPGVPVDDRSGARTVRVTVHPKRGYDIAPEAPFSRKLLRGIAPEAARREMFARGREHAEAYFGR